MNFKILDCTLRDGGYYNKWNFSLNFANKYNSIIKKAKIDIVEIGFRKKNELNDKDKLFLYTSENTLKKIKFDKNQVISVMIDLSDFKNTKDIENLKNYFPDKKNSPVSLIRLACNFENKNLLRSVVKILKNKNYLIAANLMKFTLLKNISIINFFEYAKKIKIDFFYLADSLGNCKPAGLIKLSNILKKKFSLKKFGFHAHDNLGLALSNSVAAIKMGFGFIDTSINGMGRGAGNLKLEEFLKKQKKHKESALIQSFIQNKMLDLKKKYNWGTNIFYKKSAKYNIHPTFIQRLMEEKKHNNNVIKRIISFLSKLKSSSYDANIFDNLFLNNSSIKEKSYNLENKEILIVGAADPIGANKEIIQNKNKCLIATLNYNSKINHKLIDYIFICNPYRIITEINLIKDKRIIIPNIKKLFKGKNNKFIYYNINKDKNFSIQKTECSFNKNLVLFYSIAFCISNKFKKIKITHISKNPINKLIIKQISQYLKQESINTKLEYKFI
jgi:4-hydroxy 2-oxovalerate aldolase